MSLTHILPQFVRLPWLVGNDQNYRDKEVAGWVEYDSQAGGFFRNPPLPEHLDTVLHSIAPVVTLALFRGRGEALQSRNRWASLSPADQGTVLGILKLDPARHNSVLRLVVDNDWRFRLASYLAAAYAFTTYTRPYVTTFDQIVQEGFASLSGGDTFKLREMREAGLLILLGTGGPVAGAERIYGFLSSMLSKRLSQGKIHVILDSPDGDVLMHMMRGRKINRADVMTMYRDIFPSSLRVHNLFFGPGVYMDPIDREEGRG